MAVYIVQEGDTLGAIAQRYSTTVGALQALNDPNIPDPNRIFIDQRIEVPGSWIASTESGSRNPWEHFSSATIAAACDGSVANIEANWPHIHWALAELGISGRLTQAGAIATVRLEVGPKFSPIEEFPSRFWDGYHGGPNYHGRGYIQLTHDYNYRQYGDLIGIDLVSNPERALDKSVSAWTLAHYFRMRGTSAAAERRDWPEVRRSVLGRLQPGAIEAIVLRLGV